MAGDFIVIEGLDGCGKTTQAKMLAERLGALHVAQPTHEGPIGKRIRAWLAGEYGTDVTEENLAELFAADRAWHLNNVILPALHSGRHVVCERYVLSSLVYQGDSEEQFARVLQLNAGFPAPTHCFWLAADPGERRRRIVEHRNLDHLEAAPAGVDDDRQRRMLQSLGELAKLGWVTIPVSAMHPIETVAENLHAIWLQFTGRLRAEPLPRSVAVP